MSLKSENLSFKKPSQYFQSLCVTYSESTVTLHLTSQTGIGLGYGRQILRVYGRRSLVEKEKEKEVSSNPLPLQERRQLEHLYGFIQRRWRQNGKLWKLRSTSYLFVVFFLSLFFSHLTWPYHIIRSPS